MLHVEFLDPLKDFHDPPTEGGSCVNAGPLSAEAKTGLDIQKICRGILL